jgi:hypothetical protein
VKEVQLITKQELAKKPPGEVVVCPSKVDGIKFLKKYNAWGFVPVKRHPPYFALYVSKPESSVLYFGEIESISPPLKSKEELVGISDEDMGTFEPGKRFIRLKQGTLVKFKEPIPLKNKNTAPQGLRYTTLEKLVQADDVGKLWRSV